MIKHFIFDLDGTLVYTLDDLKIAMNKMLCHYGFDEVDTRGVLAAINHGTERFVRGCLPKEYQDDPVFLKEAVSVYKGIYEKEYIITSRPYPEVPEILKYCKGIGAKIAVFSNKHDTCTKGICEALFPDTFDFVLGGGRGFEHKPSPEGAIYISELFGAEPCEVGFVGDSDVDMQTAINAGMIPIGVSWGYRPAEILSENGAKYIISSAEDFIKASKNED